MVQNPMILYHSAELLGFYVVCFVFVFYLKTSGKNFCHLQLLGEGKDAIQAHLAVKIKQLKNKNILMSSLHHHFVESLFSNIHFLIFVLGD